MRWESENDGTDDYAMRSQKIKMMATQRKTLDKNCSSASCGEPCAGGAGLPSLKLNVEAKIPKGKAPIPKENWNPPSPPNPKFGKAPDPSGSVLCPGGLGGSFSLGSWGLGFPRP